ncbi:MAG: ATP-binding protein [Lachnospiraceae bacterium]|nr:ATP-binding protein [Lachnospiraceae bacterium]
MKNQQRGLFGKSDSVLHKLFWDSFWVMLASELSVAVSRLIDSLMVSNFLGTEMFAAQSLVSPFFGLIAIASGLMATGAQVVVSKSIAKGQFNEADQAFSLALLIGLIIAVVTSAACFLFGDLISEIFGASREEPELFAAAKAYLTGLSAGTIPLTLNVILTPILQINGDRKRVKSTMFLITGVNIIFNSLSIFVFDLGMLGIGLATSIAEWCGMVVYLLHFRKRNIMCHIRMRGMQLRVIKDVLVIGFPKATVRVCNTLRPLLINRWIMFLSTSAAMSAVGINNNIRDFFRIPETAIALAIMLIAGTFYGEQDKKSLKNVVRISMTYNVLINVALSVILFAFAPYLVAVYEKTGTEAYSMALICIRWTSMGLIFYAVNEYFMDFMLGTGRHKYVHVFTFFERFIYAIVCAYVLGLIFGIKGVFASFSIAELCFTVHILVHVWVKNKKWPKELEQFMLLPADFEPEPDMILDCSVCSIEEVTGISKIVMDFCRERHIDRRRAYFAALCTEEMAANIVQHGFVPEKQQSLMIRVVVVNDDLILRFRDSCRLFNIREKYDSADRKDVTKNIGIRLVMGMAKDVMYVNTLNLNTTIVKI